MVFRSFFIFYSYNLFFPFFFLLFFIMQKIFSYSRCGYCKSLNHELTILSGLLEAENIDAYIISIDATIEKKVLITHIYILDSLSSCINRFSLIYKLAEKEGLDGYPTINIYQHGRFSSNYFGPRKSRFINIFFHFIFCIDIHTYLLIYFSNII